MSEFFLNIVNMSISASWIVLAVLLLRLLLKKAPKWITVLLWGIVAVRLICPFTVESVMSLIPSSETFNPGLLIETPEINTGFPVINNTLNPIIQDTTVTIALEKGVNALKLLVWIFSKIWIIGIALMLVYAIISFFHVKRKIGTAVLLRGNIYQSETVVSPFVLGIIKPKIYLPFNISEQDMDHVIAHEQAHIRRKDHWWKPLGFLLLTLHWFNPLMWLGYVLLCRDIELACDEKVVKEMNTDQRADYSQALLTCSVNRRMIAACPLAFGEVGVKDRVKSVLSYKKPAFWIIIVAIVASAVAAVCFLTNPTSDRLKNIEKLTLSQTFDETVIVWVGDGETYHSMGALSTDLLQDLSEIKISQKEISLNRDEDRDKSHTIILQTKEDADPTIYSNLKGLYIHFNSDFTSVWVNNDIKPTLSYRVINPKKAQELYNYIVNYNVSESVVGGVDDPANMVISADVEQLKAKFPMYFDLTTPKGLEVYIWQLAEGSYSCGLLSGVNREYTQEELWDLHKSSASIEEMRAIIADYISNGEVTKDAVTIKAIQMPHSSYFYTIDDAYRQRLNELFWSGLPIVESSQYSPIIDTATFDIDGDGRDEQCSLRYGPTSGLSTFIISASENGELEYFNIFNSPFVELNFEQNADGQTRLAVNDGEDTRYMGIEVYDGNIIISSDDQDIFYWGEQGVNW